MPRLKALLTQRDRYLFVRPPSNDDREQLEAAGYRAIRISKALGRLTMVYRLAAP